MPHSTANGPANGIPRVTPAVLADIFGTMPNAPAPGSEAAALIAARELVGRLGLDEVLRRLGHDPDVAPPPPPAPADDDDDDGHDGYRVLQPLVRCVLVAQSVSDPGQSAEIEICITDEDLGGLAAFHQLPEAGRAGWCRHSLNGFVIAFRSAS